MRSMVPYADIMKISDEETELLSGKADPKEAAEVLLGQGVSCVVVTLGADGAILKTKNVEVQVKGKPRKAVDTTGAGDSFWGGLLSRLALNNVKPADLTAEQAVEYLTFANAVAGLCGEERSPSGNAYSGTGNERIMRILLTAVNAKYIHSNLAVIV